MDRGAKSLVESRLRKITAGGILLVDGAAQTHFGDAKNLLQATVTVHDPRFYRRLVTGGGLGAAESLMEGEWSADDLVALVRIFVRNMNISDQLDQGVSALAHAFSRLGHWLRRNTAANARKNIHAHYDLGNDFFRLFLDDTMAYSCGVFPQVRATMREASLGKFERACRKLELTPRDHLLEIGTGWGGLAIHAAKQFGCRVTTTTISEEQYTLARERVAAEGLQDRVTVLQQDYRALTGTFDKLVSIEMIEAVGHQYFDEFFRTCSRLLAPHGRMLLQGITILEQRYDAHISSIDFIRKYIFPGGDLPSVSALLAANAKAGDLRPIHLEDLAPHYVLTLRRWRDEFWRRIDAVRAQGYDERFIRMWDYYFAYCEAAFTERQTGLVQLLLAKPAADVSATGWNFAPIDLGDWESAR